MRHWGFPIYTTIEQRPDTNQLLMLFTEEDPLPFPGFWDGKVFRTQHNQLITSVVIEWYYFDATTPEHPWTNASSPLST